MELRDDLTRFADSCVACLLHCERAMPESSASVMLRVATVADAAVLAEMNHRLIRDEGHRSRMTVPQLRDRMDEWLRAEYAAVVVELDDAAVGYALYRRDPEYVYLRQLYVEPEYRRRG